MHFTGLAKDFWIQVAAANCLSRDSLHNEASHVEQPLRHEGTAGGWIFGARSHYRSEVLCFPATASSLEGVEPDNRVNATSHPFKLPLPNHQSNEEWESGKGGEGVKSGMGCGV